MWLARNPQNIPPTDVTPTVMMATAAPRLSPMKHSASKHAAGTAEAVDRGFIASVISRKTTTLCGISKILI